MNECYSQQQQQCRLCLNNTNQCLNVFDEKLTKMGFLKKVLTFFEFEVKPYDFLPKNICIQCIACVTEFCDFIEVVRHNQEILFTPLIYNDNNVVSTNKNENDNIILEDILNNKSTKDADDDENEGNQNNINSHTINIPNTSSIDITTVTDYYIEIDDSNKSNQSNFETEGYNNTEGPNNNNNYDDDFSDAMDIQYIGESDNDNNNYDDEDVEDEIDNNDADDDDDDDVEEIVEEETINSEHKKNSIVDVDNDKFVGFPKAILKNTKLLIKGQELIDLISKFYSLECDLCPDESKPIGIENITALFQHYNDVHSIKGYVTCCGTKLVKNRAITLHMARHLQPDAFKCPKCNKMLTSPKILLYHIQNHLPEKKRPLACGECPRKFSYFSALQSHQISHKPLAERDMHICDECGKTFSSPGRLSTHINVAHVDQKRDFICHICAKQFTCGGNLTYHLTTHQPKVHQVQCTECNKWLKNKLCLKKHMVQHSSILNKCTICNYSSANRQCLTNHIRVHHTDIKPFSCEDCGKTFKLKSTLTNHMVQHTGNRKFQCEFCSRKFASSGNYYSHRKRMHSPELAKLKIKQENEERKIRESKVFKSIQ